MDNYIAGCSLNSNGMSSARTVGVMKELISILTMCESYCTMREADSYAHALICVIQFSPESHAQIISEGFDRSGNSKPQWCQEPIT